MAHYTLSIVDGERLRLSRALRRALESWEGQTGPPGVLSQQALLGALESPGPRPFPSARWSLGMDGDELEALRAGLRLSLELQLELLDRTIEAAMAGEAPWHPARSDHELRRLADLLRSLEISV